MENPWFNRNLYNLYANTKHKNGSYVMLIITFYMLTQPSGCGGNAKGLSKLNPTNSDRTSRLDEQVVEYLCRVQSTLVAPKLSLLLTHLANSCAVYTGALLSKVFILAPLGVLR